MLAYFAFKYSLIIDRPGMTDLHFMTTTWERKTYGLTVTPSAQALCVGGRPLSGGGWKAPPVHYPSASESSAEKTSTHSKDMQKRSALRC